MDRGAQHGEGTAEPDAAGRSGEARHGQDGASASDNGNDPQASIPSIAETSLVDVSNSRLRVLKALDGNRRTASELARELDLNKSTVHGYLQDLVEDGFVDRHEDEDRLWVYYSLTSAGEAIVSRDRVTLAIDIGTIAAFLSSAALGVHRFLLANEPSSGGPGTLAQPSDPSGGLPWAAIAYVALLALVLLGIGLHIYLRRRPVAAPGEDARA